MNEKETRKGIALVMAAGQGTRMGQGIKKQFLKLYQKPVLFYSLEVLEACSFIEEVVVVTGSDSVKEVQQFLHSQGYSKIRRVVAGGKERSDSVWCGLQAVGRERLAHSIVLIHDGARPMVTEEILERAYLVSLEAGACVVGMPVKDTVVISDEEAYISETPNRDCVWQVQTPQVFRGDWIYEAYQIMMASGNMQVTDDASVLRSVLHKPVKLVRGSYENIKITTPEDIEIAKAFLGKTGNEKA